MSGQPEASSTTPVAGWYQSPSGTAGVARYWDGDRWTDTFAPMDDTGVTGKPIGEHANDPAVYARPNLSRRTRTIVAKVKPTRTESPAVATPVGRRTWGQPPGSSGTGKAVMSTDHTPACRARCATPDGGVDFRRCYASPTRGCQGCKDIQR